MRKSTVLALAALAWATAGAAGADEYFVSFDEAKALVGKPDVRFVFAGTEKEFAQGHIPGSVVAYAHDLHLLDDVKACKGLPMCEARAADLIGKTLGIDASTQVVVYDTGPGVNSSGTWFFFRLYGQGKARILEGGLPAWQQTGGPVATDAAAKPPPKSFTPAVQWQMVASRDEVVKATGDAAHYLILDSRHTLDEYTGKQLLPAMAAPGKEETVKRGGAIPGAIFSPWSKYAGHKDGHPARPTLKDAAELQKQLGKHN